MNGEVRSKHMKHVKNSVYGKQKKVALLSVELKNIGAAPLKTGVRRPYWMVRCSDGQQVSNNHSFMVQSSTLLRGGFPQEQVVAPNQAIKGTLAFYIPNFSDLNMLFFKAQGRLARDFGETESLVLKTNSTSVKGGRAAIGETNSKAPWVSNGHWKMRVTGARWVNNLKQYQRLPFNARMVGPTKEKNLKQLGNIFKRRKRVLLLQMELKNLTGEKQKVGVKRPYWFLGCADGTKLSNSNAFVRQVSFVLEGGMPQETVLNPNDTVRGTMAFFVPEGKNPTELFYKAQGHISKSFLKTRSIMMSLPPEAR